MPSRWSCHCFGLDPAVSVVSWGGGSGTGKAGEWVGRGGLVVSIESKSATKRAAGAEGGGAGQHLLDSERTTRLRGVLREGRSGPSHDILTSF